MNLSPQKRIRTIFTQLFKLQNQDDEGSLYFRLILQLTFYPHIWEKLLITDHGSDPIFKYIIETVHEGEETGEFINNKAQEISLLLGYIALGFNFKGHEFIKGDVNINNISDLIIRMIKK